MVWGGIGSPALTTDNFNSPLRVVASTLIGASGEPCERAFPTRLDSSCPMRPWSQSTGSAKVELIFDHAVRIRDLKFVDHLSHRGHKIATALDLKVQATAQTTARKVEHVVDQVLHSMRASKHQLDDRRCVRAGVALHAAETGFDAGKGIAQVMAEHGDKLLPQLGSTTFRLEAMLRGQARLNQTTFISPPLGCRKDGQAREKQLPVTVPALNGVRQYGELLTFRRHQVESDFVEEPLHA